MPAVVIAASIVAILTTVWLLVLIGRVSEEVLRLRREAGALSDLRPALVALRTDVRTTSEAWRALGRR